MCVCVCGGAKLVWKMRGMVGATKQADHSESNRNHSVYPELLAALLVKPC